MKKSMRAYLGAALVAGVAMSATLPVQAQDFPSKPIRLILPLGAGQSADMILRTLSVPMSREANVPVLVDNRPGASGFIAVQSAKNAPPDGYTLLIGSGQTHGQNSALFKSLPYDPVADFTPVIFLNRGGFAIVVPDSSPFKSAQDLLDAAKAAPDTLTYGSASTGTRLSAELMQQQSGTEMRYVPYKSAPQAVTDLIGGVLDFVVSDIPTVQGMVQQGRLRALAVTGLERHAMLPNIPTLNEAGLPGYEMTAWAGVFAPAGTPPDTVQKLNSLFRHALASPEGQEFYRQAGLKPEPSTPEELGEHVKAQLKKWAEVVQAAGIQPE